MGTVVSADKLKFTKADGSIMLDDIYARFRKDGKEISLQSLLHGTGIEAIPVLMHHRHKSGGGSRYEVGTEILVDLHKQPPAFDSDKPMVMHLYNKDTANYSKKDGSRGRYAAYKHVQYNERYNTGYVFNKAALELLEAQGVTFDHADLRGLQPFSHASLSEIAEAMTGEESWKAFQAREAEIHAANVQKAREAHFAEHKGPFIETMASLQVAGEKPFIFRIDANAPADALPAALGDLRVPSAGHAPLFEFPLAENKKGVFKEGTHFERVKLKDGAPGIRVLQEGAQLLNAIGIDPAAEFQGITKRQGSKKAIFEGYKELPPTRISSEHLNVVDLEKSHTQQRA